MKHTLRNLMILMMTVSLAFGLACKEDRKRDKDKEEEEAKEKGNEEAVSEITDQLDKLVKGASLYYLTPRVSRDGSKLPCQFPATNEWTPNGDPCDSKGRFEINYSTWDSDTWSALTYQINDAHYGQYRVESSGTLSSATMTVFGRYKNCESGKWITYWRTLTGDPQANFAECSVGSISPLSQGGNHPDSSVTPTNKEASATGTKSSSCDAVYSKLGDLMKAADTASESEMIPPRGEFVAECEKESTLAERECIMKTNAMEKVGACMN
jgi:hypothetical protein